MFLSRQIKFVSIDKPFLLNADDRLSFLASLDGKMANNRVSTSSLRRRKRYAWRSLRLTSSFSFNESFADRDFSTDVPDVRAVPPSRLFPPAEAADDDGLLAFGDSLTPDSIVDALVHGIFPWTIQGPGAVFADEMDEDSESEGTEENLSPELGSACFADNSELEEANDGSFREFANANLRKRRFEMFLSSLSPRVRNAKWNGFDVSSLKTFQETGEVVGWWSPDPRAVFDLNDFYVSRRLERTIRSGKFRVSFDEAFSETMLGCASAKERATTEGTWITREFYANYCRLFELGLAHSAECWLGERLVGGVYGVAINGFFDGESMFSVERDASKVALISLLRRLKERGFQLFDLQILNPHTESLGGREILRADYLRRLDAALRTRVKFD